MDSGLRRYDGSAHFLKHVLSTDVGFQELISILTGISP
jgi:hypothetical protein